jgi:hypothetical protein
MAIVRDDILGAYLWRILRYFSQLEKKTNFSLVSLPVEKEKDRFSSQKT